MEIQPASVKSEIYTDQDAVKLLQYLIKNPRTILTPNILPTDEVGYPQLDALFGTKDCVELMSRLTEAGALVADLIDKAPKCPECGSLQVSTRYLCSKCFSFDIERSYLYEHLKCGKVASDEVFRKGNQVICPKCQAILHNFGVEYRAVGAWYKCKACDESFNVPAHSHFCRTKRHQFTPDRVRLEPILQYRLNPQSVTEIRREIMTYAEALPVLEDAELTFNAPHTIVGKSGEEHVFDIVVSTKGRWSAIKMIGIDVFKSEAPISSDVVRTFAAKTKDARPAAGFLIAVPGLDEDARGLAQKLKVNCVEAESVKEATLKLLNLGEFKEQTH
jgi:hypothetical protein